MKKYFTSRNSVILLLLAMVGLFAYTKRWEKKVIEWDVIYYYSYLPATFIQQDLSLSYMDRDTIWGDRLWPQHTPEGAKVIKATMGVAYMYAPFFFAAHALSRAMGWEADGYSVVYEFFLLLSNLFYVALAFVLLRKILLKYAEDSVVAWVLPMIFFGTNLYFYTLHNCMSHTYTFFLVTVMLYACIRWHENPSLKWALALGISMGLITLVRPVNLDFALLVLGYGVSSLAGIAPKLNFFWKHRLHILVMISGGMVCMIPQLIYWKWLTGHWLFWSYGNEGFFWLKPHIAQGLFSFRKGWYIYTPLMLFATAGLFMLRKRAQAWAWAMPLLFILFTYITFSWWSWWYAGGLSSRPHIDLYPIMAIGLVVFWQYAKEQTSKWIKRLIVVSIVFSALYGAYTNRMYIKGEIHYDGMNFKAWKHAYLKRGPGSVYDYIQEPDYEKALATGEE